MTLPAPSRASRRTERDVRAIVLGVDPGLAAMGFAVVDLSGRRPVCAVATTIRTAPRFRIASRFAELHWAVRQSARLWGVHLLAYEDPTQAQVGQYRAGRSTIRSVAGVQAVVGMLIGLGGELGIPVVAVTPAQAKCAVACKPASGKRQVQAAVRALVEGCPERMSEYAADAVAIAIAGERVARADAVCAVGEWGRG